MKTKILNTVILLIAFCVSSVSAQAQLLNKLKKKAENAVSKPSDKPAENNNQAASGNSKENNNATTTSGNNAQTTNATPDAETKSSGESDFIPGSTVLYFDNFEKEKNGDSPVGWITSSSAEVAVPDGQKGKWLKLYSQSTQHYTRSKKQSWSSEFTIEFDLVIVMKDYDPRIYFSLINTKGSLVTDEKILQNKYYSAYVSAILGDGGKKTRVSLSKDNNINSSFADAMSEKLTYTNGVPVHISMMVQGKRFRFWWGVDKIYDAQIINQQYIPNQFGIEFGPVGGCDYYISNIRIAKDIPATKPVDQNNQATNNNKPVVADNNSGQTNTDAPASVKLQSKILNTDLTFAQIMKTGENTFTFSAGKEEGNYKENYFKFFLVATGSSLKAETYNFKEINQKNPLYGTKKYPEIYNTEAVLYYGSAKKPYIYKFSPVIANGTMASYVDAALTRHLPAVSPNTKFVIEKVENGKASGYFVVGIMIQGLKPVTKGDAMTETFTDGFSGELKCTFSNIPVY